jgi:hypothetical protein
MDIGLELLYLMSFGGIAVTGAYILRVAVINTANGVMSKSWLTTEATIRTTSPIKHTDRSVKRDSPSGVELNQIKVEYQYEVKGVDYISQRLGFVGFSNRGVFYSKRMLLQLSLQIFDNEKIKVYYHSKKPQVSALLPGFFPVNLLFLFTGIAFLVTGLVSLGLTLNSWAIFTLICLCLSFLILKHPAEDLILGIKSRSWPTVQGTITSARADFHAGDSGSPYHEAQADSYEALVKYKYQIDGINYLSNRLRFGSTRYYFSRKSAEKILSPYYGGKSVEVYYHPRKPRISTLQTGFKLGQVWVLLFITGFTFLSIGLALLFLRVLGSN